MRRKRLILLTLAVFVGGAVVVLVVRAKRPTGELAIPLLTDHMLRRGLAAATAHEWSTAIDSFRQAHVASPRLPQPLFNLALAHDRADHPLIAMCWYHAYLLAAPDGHRRQEVVARLDELDQFTREQISSLATLSCEVVAVESPLLREADFESSMLLTRDQFLFYAMVQASIGNESEAAQGLDVLGQMNLDADWYHDARRRVAECYLAAGWLECAEALVAQLPAPHANGIRQRLELAIAAGATADPYHDMLTLEEQIRSWTVLADQIVSGAQLQSVSSELQIPPARIAGRRPPELGVAAFLDGLRLEESAGSMALNDGIRWLCLTYLEIKRRQSKATQPPN